MITYSPCSVSYLEKTYMVQLAIWLGYIHTVCALSPKIILRKLKHKDFFYQRNLTDHILSVTTDG